MSPQAFKTPSRRRLLVVGAVALAVASAVAAHGIVSRDNSQRQARKWAAQQAIPTVALAKLDQGDATQNLVLPGNIQPNYKASIYARVSGYLKNWDQDIGAHVKGGQQLALVDAPDLDQQLDQARADLATAVANEQLAALTAKRWNSLVASQSVSQQAADEKTGDAAAKKAIVDAAQANVRRLEALESFKRIVAPFDGVVTARNTDIGALINAGSGAGQALFEVADLHKVRIYIQVPQAYAAQLQPGMKATFDMPQSPGQQFEARLVTTSHAMDANSRSMLVELQADNPDGRLFAGAYCQVHFQLPGNPGTVRVPATALVPVDQGAQVAILGEGNKVTLKTVQLGRDLGDSVEVVAGLSASDHVIDSPPETLRSGDTVRLAATTAARGATEAAAGASPAAKSPPGTEDIAAGAAATKTD